MGYEKDIQKIKKMRATTYHGSRFGYCYPVSNKMTLALYLFPQK